MFTANNALRAQGRVPSLAALPALTTTEAWEAFVTGTLRSNTSTANLTHALASLPLLQRADRGSISSGALGALLLSALDTRAHCPLNTLSLLTTNLPPTPSLVSTLHATPSAITALDRLLSEATASCREVHWHASQVATIAHAQAALCRACRPFWATITPIFPRLAHELSPSELTRVTVAAAALSLTSRNLWAPILAAANSLATHFSPAEHAAVLRALAGPRPTPLPFSHKDSTHLLCTTATRLCTEQEEGGFTASEVADVAWSCAILLCTEPLSSAPDPDYVTHHLHTALLSAVRRHSLDLGFPSTSLPGLLSALALLSQNPTRPPPPLLAMALVYIPPLPTPAAPSASHTTSSASPGAQHEEQQRLDILEVSEPLLRELASCAAQVDANDLVLVMSACAALEITPPQALSAAVRDAAACDVLTPDTVVPLLSALVATPPSREEAQQQRRVGLTERAECLHALAAAFWRVEEGSLPVAAFAAGVKVLAQSELLSRYPTQVGSGGAMAEAGEGAPLSSRVLARVARGEARDVSAMVWSLARSGVQLSREERVSLRDVLMRIAYAPGPGQAPVVLSGGTSASGQGTLRGGLEHVPPGRRGAVTAPWETAGSSAHLADWSIQRPVDNCVAWAAHDAADLLWAARALDVFADGWGFAVKELLLEASLGEAIDKRKEVVWTESLRRAPAAYTPQHLVGLEVWPKGLHGVEVYSRLQSDGAAGAVPTAGDGEGAFTREFAETVGKVLGEMQGAVGLGEVMRALEATGGDADAALLALQRQEAGEPAKREDGGL